MIPAFALSLKAEYFKTHRLPYEAALLAPCRSLVTTLHKCLWQSETYRSTYLQPASEFDPHSLQDQHNMSTRAQVTAQIGGIPTIGLDVPICSVFIALFVSLAASHMTILQINLRRGHKFIFNGLCFGFAMSRIAACTLRLVWATRPSDVDVSLVASVFLNAGIVLIYIINNLLAWRMVRSAAPQIGWNKVARIANRVLLWGILVLILH
jgi:hypothetical protein